MVETYLVGGQCKDALTKLNAARKNLDDLKCQAEVLLGKNWIWILVIAVCSILLIAGIAFGLYKYCGKRFNEDELYMPFVDSETA